MRALKKLTILDYDQFEFPEQMLGQFCSDMRQTADMEGFYGIMRYLIEKKSLDVHRRPKKAILSLVGLFFQPAIKKNKFYKFWSVFKLVLNFTIEQQEIQKIQNLQQTLKQLFTFLSNLLAQQPDKKQIIYLQNLLQKYLKLLVPGSQLNRNELTQEAKDISSLIFINFKVLDFMKLLLIQMLQFIDEQDDIAHHIQLWITIILNKQKSIFTIEFFSVLCKYTIKSILINLLSQDDITRLLLKIYEQVRFIVQKQQISEQKYQIIEYVLGRSSLMKDLEYGLVYLYHSQKIRKEQFVKLQKEHNFIKQKVYKILKTKQKSDINNIASLKQLWFYSRQLLIEKPKQISITYITQIEPYSELHDIIKLYHSKNQSNYESISPNITIPEFSSLIKVSLLQKTMIIQLFSKLPNKNDLILYLGSHSLSEINQMIELMLITFKIYDEQFFKGLYQICIEIIVLKLKQDQAKYSEKFISQLTKLMDFMNYIQLAVDNLVSICSECFFVYQSYSCCQTCQVLCVPLKWSPKSKREFMKLNELYHKRLVNMSEDLFFIKTGSQKEKILQKILILIISRYC